jgi:alpha-beta hydrolase superfamily lysophospholipase
MKLEVIVQEPEFATQSTPLLFVHGMWHGAWCWAEHFVPYFAQRGHPAYALSLRGHGASEGRERLRWTSLAQYVADLEQVVNEMERAPVLIGHSMGGMIVQKYLESHQAPAAVLLASAPPKGLLGATLRLAGRHPLVFLNVNLTLKLYPAIGTPSLCREMLFSADMPEPEVEAYFARMQDEAYRAYLDMVLLNLPRPKRVKTPLLVLGAVNDKAISIGEVEATARAYDTQAEILADMAHDMMLEAGWQAVADRILSWLGEQGL